METTKLYQGLLSEIMHSHNFDTVICSTGAEAVEISQDHSFNLICIAYHLPDLSGEILCKHLRSNPATKNSRIILFTGEDNPEVLKGALRAGATDIYNKNNIAQFQTYLQRYANLINSKLIGNALLIEDSPAQQKWLKLQLEFIGLEVDAFFTAEQALDAFLENPYDIIITDMVLSGNMSGLNLVRSVRREASEKGLTPIFAITAYDEISRRIELFQLGINDYMTKPINPEEMLFRIARLIKENQLFNELSRERKVLQEMAMLDPLTQLYNRIALNQLLPKSLADCKRKKIPVSLVMMDLDFFKRINDEHGHDQGDKVLMETGNWLRNAFRKGDLVFRWGGEEFVIFLSKCTLAEAKILMEKQRERFSKRQMADHSITASFGISSYEDFDTDISHETLFKQADTALYKAKQGGRNCVVCAD
ncbi:MAG: diguanylate cyclase [Methylomonas sp.]|uniref:diguanylate cyclase n=1 Tax=Methylomonas sp. TaxID=418 RepID=UPI0025D4C1B5|nr:diguanylate cyclase [Methylomonas sp.]MCK9607647.1 diguanylate cyclase [Methylomonas sp.]